MAYLNEFPNLKPNVLNSNWLLEQYSTFNSRIQEILNHFDETITVINGNIDEFKREVNSTISQFETEIRNEVASIENAIDQVSDNVSNFVAEHMNEWQLDSMVDENNNVIIGDYDPEEPITEGGVTRELIINNNRILLGDIYSIGGGYLVSLSKTTLTNNNYGTVRLIETNDFKTAFPEYYDRMKASEYTTIEIGYVPLPVAEEFTAVNRSGLAITRIVATRSTTSDDFGFWLSWTRCNDTEGNNAIASLVNDVVLNFYVILYNDFIGE